MLSTLWSGWLLHQKGCQMMRTSSENECLRSLKEELESPCSIVVLSSSTILLWWWWGFSSCSEIYDIRGRFWLISNYVCYFRRVVGNVIFYPLENGNHKIPLTHRGGQSPPSPSPLHLFPRSNKGELAAAANESKFSTTVTEPTASRRPLSPARKWTINHS